jgi:hypothetical protein
MPFRFNIALRFTFPLFLDQFMKCLAAFQLAWFSGSFRTSIYESTSPLLAAPTIYILIYIYIFRAIFPLGININILTIWL